MIGAQDPLPVGECLLIDRDGPTEVPGRLVGEGQVVAGGEGVGVVGAQHPLPVGEGLLIDRDGPTEVPGLLVGAGQLVTGHEGVGVVGPRTRSLSVSVCS